jgi:hypothetical protein
MSVNFYSTDYLSKIISYIELATKPTVVLSTGFFRRYTCPENCGSCCHKISLEYISDSPRWERFRRNYPELVKNFKHIKIDENMSIYVDNQEDYKERFCKYLDLTTGRCKIHTATPFPCEFVLSKFIDNKSRERSVLTTTYYGRGWAFLRVDKQTRGAMCRVEDFSYEKLLVDLDLLRELYYYALVLDIKTKLPYIINYIQDNLPIFREGKLPKTNIIFNQENTL